MVTECFSDLPVLHTRKKKIKNQHRVFKLKMITCYFHHKKGRTNRSKIEGTELQGERVLSKKK